VLAPSEAQALRDRLTRFAPLSTSSWKTLVNLGQRQSLSKGAFFTRPGEPSTRFAVVLSGWLRHFYVDAKGKESVKAFRGPLEVSGPYAEILQRRPSRTFIEALTNAELLVFEVAKVDAAAERSLELQRLVRRFVEVQFVAKEQREFEFLMLSAEERYRQFCTSFPDLVTVLPQYQIASYIGITPVALSRIRARSARSAGRSRARAK